MFYNKLIIIYTIFICLKCVSLLPVSVQSESTIVNDQAQHKNVNNFGSSSEKASEEDQSKSGFRQENENKHVNAQDSGSYSNVKNDKNTVQDMGQHFGEKSHRENAGSASQFGRQGGHKKGHRKSGYQNSYHKEESENNSSFYDDSDDQGGHFVYDSQDGGFSSAGSDRNQGSYLDDHLYSNANSQRGLYDRGGNFDKIQADKNRYNEQQYYNNHHNQGNNNAHNAQGEIGRRSENRYYRPHYYSNYEPRRTITVYEDPRDLYYPQKYEQGYDSKLIQLNFKQNPNIYYPTAFNDYYL